MRKIYIQNICKILFFISIFTLITDKTFARENQSVKKATSVPWQDRIDKGEIQEVVSKRNRFAKHFIKADGTTTMFTSTKPQHFLSGGVWRDIDVNIKPSSHNGFAFANEENSFKTYYPSTYNSPIKTKITEGEMYEKVNAIYITDNNDAVLKSFSGNIQANATSTKNSITYKNYLPGVDIRYSIQNEGRKFDLVLNRPPPRTCWPSTPVSSGWTPRARPGCASAPAISTAPSSSWPWPGPPPASARRPRTW